MPATLLVRITLLLSVTIGASAATALAAESAKPAAKKPDTQTSTTTRPAHPAKKSEVPKKAETSSKTALAKTSPQGQKDTVDKLVEQARAAYWHGDIPAAIAGYQKLIKKHPQPRWYGELGNIYLQVGRPREAAQNYYHAARALMAAGRLLEAGALLPTLQRLDPPLAAKLLASESPHKETH
ncbi:tetratricopeptide repeat protein [Igneacidithiobacillus copahuensis]|nr:hypothetical protein [Igneacidithiobacillus copahuensis]